MLPIVIDCEACPVRDVRCGDCMVTSVAALGPLPERYAGTAPPGQGHHPGDPRAADLHVSAAARHPGDPLHPGDPRAAGPYPGDPPAGRSRPGGPLPEGRDPGEEDRSDPGEEGGLGWELALDADDHLVVDRFVRAGLLSPAGAWDVRVVAAVDEHRRVG